MDTPPLLSPLSTAGSPSRALAAPCQLHTHKAHERGFAGWRPQGAATTQGQLTPCREQGVTHKPSGKPHSNTAQSKATRRAGEWVIEPPCPAAVQLHTLQLGKGGKWGPQLKPHQQQPLLLSSHRNALIPVAQGHGQALSSPGMGCLSVSSELSSGLGPPEALQISMHAKTACHSFLILFGSSAPPLLGRGKGITDETNFFKLGEIEITTENCPFFCLAPPQHSHSSS